MKKEFIPILLILLLGAALRWFKLGIIPPGVTLDEMGYIFNSYSIAQTGKNVFGEFLPFLTWMVPNGFPFMPIPIYLSAPIFWFFGLSATSGRLLSSLLGVTDILLIYLLVLRLFKNRTLALISSLFLAISPWHLHFSRSAYDFNYAFFFYLLGIVIFLYETSKNKLSLFSTFFFLLAVFSYRGMNIILIPLYIILLWYRYDFFKANREKFVFFLTGLLVIIFSLLLLSLKYGNAYTAEGQALFTNPKIQEYVDSQSRDAKGPLFLKRLFLNKPTQILDNFRENYIRSYSPEFLFLNTEPSQIYSIWSRGRIYFIDSLFIVLGIAFILMKKKREGFFVLGLLLISALPGGIGGQPFSARNFFMASILPILSGGGVLFLCNLKTFEKYKKVLVIFIVLIYTYALASYLFDYYLRYPKIGGEAWGESFKTLSSKIIKNENKYQKIMVGPTTHGDFIQFAFYAKLKASEVQDIWEKSPKLHGGPFNYKNIYFIPDCLNKLDKNTLFISPAKCIDQKPFDVIKDGAGNDVWRLYK